MEDRRIKKTKSNLFNALFHLACEKDFHKITVKELCEWADVNKSTFYLHFRDIYDCREQWLQAIVEDVFRASTISPEKFMNVLQNPSPYLNRLLDYIEANMPHYQKLFNSPYYGSYMKDFKEKALSTLIQANHFSAVENYPRCASIAFLLGGVIDTIFFFINRYDRPSLFYTLEYLIQHGFDKEILRLTVDEYVGQKVSEGKKELPPEQRAKK